MIKIIKPYITFAEVEDDFKKVFESGWFTKGEFVTQFKLDLKRYTGAKYVHLTTSATTALTMALKALNIKTGDEVIVSDFSFPATANVVEEIGAIPVFVDVSLETYNMLPKKLEQRITEKTKAVIFVDALGNVSGIHAIKNICDKYNIPLIEDGACAIGSSELGVKSGNIADITCFSFHPRKLLTSGEGGAILFNDDKYNEFFDVKLNHGAKVKDNIHDFVDFGYNYRLPELQCIMGITQLKKLDEIVLSRNIVKDKYVEKLRKFGFEPQLVLENVVHNIQSMVFKVPINANRNDLIAFLKENDVETTIGTYCLSNTTYYRTKYNTVQTNAKFLEENTITFPCYDGVDVEYIMQQVESYMINQIDDFPTSCY